MKNTFTTIMPDKVGAFLKASRIFSDLGLNITRVSYNKAVDSHMLFIEAEGTKAQMKRAEEELAAVGYLQNEMNSGRVLLLEFYLPDHPGTVLPVLELINRHSLNISYISSQENNTEYQHFRMGLFVEGGDDISAFLQQAALLCDVRIIHYDPAGIPLDNTVFYMSFANRIAEKTGLDEAERRALIIESNLLMERLTHEISSPYKTFKYIEHFADNLAKYRGDAYQPRITRHPLADGMEAVLIEPPCGSNLCLIDYKEGILCVDSGFPCYQKESLTSIQSLFPDFQKRRRVLLLTHADTDHIGLVNVFEQVFVSQKCFDNFVSENEGKPNLREQNPAHAPYVRIAKILSRYKRLCLDKMQVIGDGKEMNGEPIVKIGALQFGQLHFEVYEAAGGHVPGETIYIERTQHLLFTGDVFINIKGCTPEQAEFNKLAPYLMTSVDTNPKLAAIERKALLTLLDKGEWLLIGGHGAAMQMTV